MLSWVLMLLCHGLTLAQRQAPTKVAHSPSPCHSWAEERKKINEGLMSWDKDWEKNSPRAKWAQLKVAK